VKKGEGDFKGCMSRDNLPIQDKVVDGERTVRQAFVTTQYQKTSAMSKIYGQRMNEGEN